MQKKSKLPSACAIILAGGKGLRLGRPKQLISVGGKPMVLSSVQAFVGCQTVDEVIIVAEENVRAVCRKNFKSKKIKYALPGASRMHSLLNGFKKISGKSKLVAVHDGARPFITSGLITKCLISADKYGASVCAVPAKDTIKTSVNGRTVNKTLNRKTLWHAQTPQCYRTEILKKALKKSFKYKNATDESHLVEKLPVKVHLVKSDYKNIKVTTPEDLAIVEAISKTADENPAKLRVGLGYDLHRTTGARPFIIGGVKVPHNKGLLGHSDGDVVLHAVCDAILGAIASGEIGVFFPPTDLTLMGISSTAIAEKTMQIMKSKKASLLHLDIIIIAEEPKISPYYLAIRQSLSEIFSLPLGEVSFKAKSHEGVGAIGKGNAVACHALATVVYK